LWIIAHPDWQWLVSPEIIQEYKDVLHRKKFSFPSEILRTWEAILDRDTHLLPVTTSVEFPRDQKDAIFLACALSNNADFLITGDGDFEEAYRIVNTNIVSVSMFKRLMIDQD